MALQLCNRTSKKGGAKSLPLAGEGVRRGTKKEYVTKQIRA